MREEFHRCSYKDTIVQAAWQKVVIVTRSEEFDHRSWCEKEV